MKTESHSKIKTEQILTVMNILAWVAAVGFLIEAGALLISYIVSCVNPEAAMDLYKGRNLYDLRQIDFWYYTCVVSFMVALPVMKSMVWLLVIKTLSKINLVNPFSMEVALTLERISYLLLGTWIVGLLSGSYSEWLLHLTGQFFGSRFSGEFIFMAGLVFIISQIFKRGVEIQSDNELTI